MPVYNDGLACVQVSAETLMRETLRNGTANAGKWYASAGSAAQRKLCEAYERDDYPSEAALAKIAREVGAPSPACVKTFFDSVHWALQSR